MPADTPTAAQPDAAGTPAEPGFATAAEVAAFLGVSRARLLYTLYSAPESARYTSFEIPKRSGGVRRIDAPNGLVRAAQTKLAAYFVERHRPHPASHGFLSGRSIVTNAAPHEDRALVLNLDLADFFPSINFGRVRGLFMAAPFRMSAEAATVCAQICTHKNGLPQGAPTSPILSCYIASQLDRRLSRLAREHGLAYTRYADDITFSTRKPSLPPAILAEPPAEARGVALTATKLGDALEAAIASSGFTVNAKKVRLQTRAVRQTVTGLTVNRFPNVARERVRRIRAMTYAWRTHGAEAAGREHFARYARRRRTLEGEAAARAFRNIVYGELAFVKMVRGPADPIFLKLCRLVLEADKANPAKFLRRMIFGANDFDVFISHAGEDKEAVARPIYEACVAAGVKAFLDEPHILWGESFTTKINLALGAARTVIVVVSSHSVSKPWPLAEINAALSYEVNGEKQVLPVVVGRPDLSQLPLIAAKNQIFWAGDPAPVMRALVGLLGRGAPSGAPAVTRRPTAPPASDPPAPPPPAAPPETPRRRWFGFGPKRS